MNSRNAIAIASVVLAAILAGACGDFERGDPLPATETASPTGTNGAVSFASDVHPILIEYCEDCHSPSGEASSSDYILSGNSDDDYLTVLEFVDVENPSSSRLLTKARGTGHTGGVILSSGSAEFTTLFNWIAEGAAP